MNQPTPEPIQPNQATQDVIMFLSHPDLDFGHSPPDIQLLSDPAALQHRVHRLLDESTPLLASGQNAEELQARLGETDWPAVAQEFQSRINLTSHFFDKDAEEHRSVNA